MTTKQDTLDSRVRERQSSIVNILLVSFWRRILVASSFHCQRFRGQERITAKGKRNPVSAPTVFQRRSQSTRNNARNFCLRKRTDSPVLSFLKRRKPSITHTHSSSSSFYTRVFSTVLSLSTFYETTSVFCFLAAGTSACSSALR